MENQRGSIDSAKTFLYLFIFFHVEENEPKEDARVPLHPARRHLGRGARKIVSLKQVHALFPSAMSMLGAGQRGKPEPQRIDTPGSMGLLNASHPDG